MIIDILINGVSRRFLRHEAMRSESIGRILVHEGYFSDKLVDKLRPYHIERALGNFVKMELAAILAVLLSAGEVEE